MKNFRYRLYIGIITFVTLCFAIYYGATFIVEKKDDKLLHEAFNDFEKYFKNPNGRVNIGGNIYVDTKFYHEDIAYEKMPIPTLSQINRADYSGPRNAWQLYFNNSNEYEDDATYSFEDIDILYKLKPQNDNDEEWSGWCLNIMESVPEKGRYGGTLYTSGQVDVYTLFPLMVGFTKFQEPVPVSVPINSAYEYYVNDEYKYNKSSITIYDIKNDVENSYYTLLGNNEIPFQMSDLRWTNIQTLTWEPACELYLLAIGDTYKITYKIWKDPKKIDKIIIMSTSYTILCLIFLCFLIHINKVMRLEQKTKSKQLQATDNI